MREAVIGAIGEAVGGITAGVKGVFCVIGAIVGVFGVIGMSLSVVLVLGDLARSGSAVKGVEVRGATDPVAAVMGATVWGGTGVMRVVTLTLIAPVAAG